MALASECDGRHGTYRTALLAGLWRRIAVTLWPRSGLCDGAREDFPSCAARAHARACTWHAPPLALTHGTRYLRVQGLTRPLRPSCGWSLGSPLDACGQHEELPGRALAPVRPLHTRAVALPPRDPHCGLSSQLGVATPQVQRAGGAAEHCEQAPADVHRSFASRCVNGMQPKVVVASHHYYLVTYRPSLMP
jgi:hypothetical protein